MKLFMKQRCNRSAISFAALALALSTAIAAASAEVSGGNHHSHPSVDTTERELLDRKNYLAFRTYANIPSTTVYAPAPSREDVSGGMTTPSIAPYNPARLDELQATVKTELDALIEQIRL